MLNTYSYKGWFIEKEWDDTTLKSDETGKFADLPPVPPLEGDKRKDSNQSLSSKQTISQT